VSCSGAGASPLDGEDGRADGPGKSFRIERSDEEPDGPDETAEEQECPAAETSVIRAAEAVEATDSLAAVVRHFRNLRSAS